MEDYKVSPIKTNYGSSPIKTSLVSPIKSSIGSPIKSERSHDEVDRLLWDLERQESTSPQKPLLTPPDPSTVNLEPSHLQHRHKPSVALEDVEEMQELEERRQAMRAKSRRDREREIGVDNIVVDDDDEEEEKQIVSDLLTAAAPVANAGDDDALDQEFVPAGTSKKRKPKKQATKA